MKLKLVRSAGGALYPADNETMNYLGNLPVNCVFEVDVPNLEKSRTLTQNRALHLVCQILADQLNAAGLTQMKVLRHDAEIEWTQQAVKDSLFKPLQKAMTGKESTADANTVEYSKIYDVLCHHLSTKLGITPPAWPSRHGEGHE